MSDAVGQRVNSRQQPVKGGLQVRLRQVVTGAEAQVNVELMGESDEGLEVRYSWVTWSHRYQHTDAYFGSTCCTLIEQDGRPQIIRKTVRLNNDYIRQVIDVYHI